MDKSAFSGKSDIPCGKCPNSFPRGNWAEDLKAGKSRPDDDEFLSAKIETFGNAVKKNQKGKIRDSKTVIGILAFLALRNGGGQN